MLTKNLKIVHGIAEDVKSDPLKLGRIKVRIFDKHSELKQIAGERGIPTEDLPWAIPLISNNYGAISGIGKLPTNIQQGTELIILAQDELMQDLIILGVLPGVHQNPAKPDEGFYDPEGEYPLVDRLQEPDSNRLARKEKLDETLLLDKVERIIKAIPIAFGGSWDEPLPVDYFNPEYPHNRVYETPSGHVFEEDDTPGFERLHKWHKSGSYDEDLATGEKIIKTKSNFYITVEEDHLNIFVKEGGVHITAKEDILIKTDGYFGVEAEKGIKLATTGSTEIISNEGLEIDGETVRING